jgi:outer membrane protein OmpA-like peptidoglycan-associated protein
MARLTRSMLVAATAALTLAGCVTDPQTGQQTVSKAAVGVTAGAVTGAVLGAILGGRHSRTETIIGAGLGAVAGGAVGGYMDRQERDLRARTAGSGIDVVRKGDNIDLRLPSGITFDFNSAAVKAQFRASLDQVAQTLASYQSTYVDVTGHTDSIGTDAVNQKLSEQRAIAVADYLSYQGVNRARIATRGFGKTQPIASNADEAGRAQNRRVEIHISPITDDDVRDARGR